MCLGGRVSSSLFSLSCVYVKLILTYWRVIRNSITFTMLLYFFFFFVRTPESTDCQNFSISLKIFNLTTSTTFFDRRYYNYRQNWSPKSLNPNFAKRNQTIIRATLKSEFSELNFHAYLQEAYKKRDHIFLKILLKKISFYPARKHKRVNYFRLLSYFVTRGRKRKIEIYYYTRGRKEAFLHFWRIARRDKRWNALHKVVHVRDMCFLGFTRRQPPVDVPRQTFTR